MYESLNKKSKANMRFRFYFCCQAIIKKIQLVLVSIYNNNSNIINIKINLVF